MAPSAPLAPAPTLRCATCAGCLVSISLDRGDGSMTMHSCSTCDTRWWQRDGEPTDIHGVLGTMVDDRVAAKSGR